MSDQPNNQTPVETFNELLKGTSWWSRLIGSQFVQGIATFVGQMAYRTESLARRLLQEAFMSTAINRASILAGAEDRGYVGGKVMPSTGKASITNNTDSVQTFAFGTPVDGPNQLDYILAEAVRIEPGVTLEVEVSQLTEVVMTTTVTAETKWLEIALPKAVTAKASEVEVWVEPPRQTSQRWEKRFMFRRGTPTSRIYTESYKPTEQLVVRFGNGLAGMIPPLNSIIRLVVWCSEGETALLEGQPLTLAAESDFLKEGIKIVTTTPIAGGQSAESTEAIRRGALYATQYDQQVVWDSDYAKYINDNISGLVWLKVWGETQQEKESGFNVDNINRIFISAYSDTQSQERLEERIAALFSRGAEFNTRYSYVRVNRQPFTLLLNGSIPNRQRQDAVKLSLITMLTNKFGENAAPGSVAGQSSTKEIFEKDIWTAIDELGLLTEFTIKLVGRIEQPKLKDYVFLDAVGSTFNLEYDNAS